MTVDAQTQALSDAGYDVRAFFRSTDELSSQPAYKLRSAWRATGMSADGPRTDLSVWRPDIVHVHNLFPNFGTRWLGSINAPVVATLHNYRCVCSNGLLWRDGHDCQECLVRGSSSALRHKCYRDSFVATLPLAIATRSGGSRSALLHRADAVIVLNESAKQTFAAISRPPRYIDVVPNFVPDRAVSSGVRDGWAYVGRLEPEKGVLWLLEVWPVEEPLIVVGEGSCRNELEAIAARRSLHVSFVGSVEHDRALALIEGSRALVMPSLWHEGVPTVALEALSVGTPIMVSAMCSSADSLAANGAGSIFKIDDSGADLARCLTAMAMPDGGRRNLLARERYETDYSPRRWLDNVSRIYRIAAEKYNSRNTAKGQV